MLKNRVWVRAHKDFGEFSEKFARKKALRTSRLVWQSPVLYAHWIQNVRGLYLLSRLKGIETLPLWQFVSQSAIRERVKGGVV